MRLLFLVCLIFLVSVVFIGADTSATNPKVLQSDLSKTARYQGASNIGIAEHRLLRSNNKSDKGFTEERTGGLPVSGFEKVKTIFTPYQVPTEKLQQWIADGKSAVDVFQRLHFNKPESPLYKRHFAEWVKYADASSASNPKQSAISILTDKYGDYELFSIIKAAKRDELTKDIAFELETKQMQYWLANRKDPDEVFRLFELNMVWNGIFKNPEFTTWVKYVDDLNTKTPEKPTWMYTTLTKYFSDEVLLKKTNQMKRSVYTNAIAVKVEDDWIQGGIQSHKSPYQALLDLGLRKQADTILDMSTHEYSMVRTWMKYLEVFNERYPAEKTTMIETLTKTFGDVGVTNMVRTAKEQESTRILATRMESAQLRMWLSSDKSTDDVFKLLKLDQRENFNLFGDKPLLNKWVSFINVFIEENPDKKEAIFTAMRSRFMDRPLNQILNEAKHFPSMDDTVTKIQMNKLQGYLARREPPEKVFNLLGLTAEGENILGTAQFKWWMKYVEEFNKQNGKRESWFKTLRTELEYVRFQMIKEAMQNPSTVEIGKKVERAWLNFWLEGNKPPKDVFKDLHLDKAGERALVDPNFNTWTTYMDAFNLKHPNKQTTVIDELRASNYDRALLRMFKEAKNHPSTENLALTLENELFKKWIVEKKTAEYLHQQFGDLDTAAEMIQRYSKKLTAMTGNTL